jgi:hypothetical protein
VTDEPQVESILAYLPQSARTALTYERLATARAIEATTGLPAPSREPPGGSSIY